MLELDELKKKLTGVHALRWEELPDMGLYMDQMLTLTRQMMQEDGTMLTAAMVSNYTKAGLLPRPEKKKYTREHIVRLLAISVLKQVLSMEDTRILIEQYQDELYQPDVVYNRFLDLLVDTLKSASDRIQADAARQELRKLAVALALSAYSQRRICETIIHSLAAAPDDAAPESETDIATERSTP